MSIYRVALAGLLALSACSDPALSKKVEDLEARVAKIEEAPAAKGDAAANNADEAEARKLYTEAQKALQEGNTDEAKAKFKEMTEKFKGTRYAAPAARMLGELELVGKEVTDLEIEKWYQGETSLADGDATLLVFWEVWCPHCKREVPKLQATYEKYHDKGLNVIGLTKVTRGKTDEDVTAFISENKIGYPIAKEQDGKASTTFAVSGVPAAAVVKDGKVVWRGHPAQLKDAQIEGWIGM